MVIKPTQGLEMCSELKMAGGEHLPYMDDGAVGVVLMVARIISLAGFCV